MAFNDLTIMNNPFAVTTSTVPAATPAVTTVPIVAVAPTAPTTPPTATPVATTPLPLVTKPADKNVGLAVEKTTTKTTTPEQKSATTQKKDSMDAFFDRYYTRYKNADDQGKERFVKRYLTSMAKNPAKQAAEFERLRKAGVSADEIKILSGTIDDLNAKNQFKAADAVSNKGNKEQNQAGREVVANNYQHYDKTVQTDVSKMIVETNDVNIIKMAASHAAETDKSNQVDIVKNFQSIDNLDINKVLINQYGQYAKENEIGIHTIMSASKHSETVEYAASKIGNFDETNRAQALKITESTGNEKAVSNANESIKDAETKANSDEKTATTEKATSSNTIKDIIKSDSTNKDAQIKEAFKSATSAEKATWIDTLTPNELANMINIIPLNQLTTDVLGKVLKIMGSADSKSQKELVDRINSSCLTDVVGRQIGSLGLGMQSAYVEKAAKSGKKLQSTNMLLFAVKQDYNEKLKEQNIG